MLEYEMLKIIWWVLMGVLLIGFTIMDGHDMGIGTLLPFLGKIDSERRVIINTIGPHWDGNQVWFITAGGALFAAWPIIYATAFSGFYWAMLAVLWALFFRPVGFDYRSKIPSARWRNNWDWLLFIGGAIPPIIFGVAFGNLLQGVPFHFDENMVPYYTGSFLGLLNPFAILCGLVSSTMMTFHGAIYLAHRTEGDIQARAKKAATIFGSVMMLLFLLGGIWVFFGIKGYSIVSAIDPNAYPNPTTKAVIHQAGAWMENYKLSPVIWFFPVLGFTGVVAALYFMKIGRTALAFIPSSLAITGVICTAGLSMFPFMMPSSTNPNHSLTVWDSSSSHMTLTIMLIAAIILMPLIIFYTSWAYKVMSGKVTVKMIEENDHSVY